MKKASIEVRITATKHGVYHWWIGGEGAGKSAGKQGTETNLAKAVMRPAGLIDQHAKNKDVYIYYQRYHFDRPYPESESSISCSMTENAINMLNKADNVVDYLVKNAK